MLFEICYFVLLVFIVSNLNYQYGFYLSRLDYLTISRQGMIVIRYMEALTSQKDWVINLIIRIMKTGSPETQV